ncbi:MAG: hypothetical protein BWY14_01271 [Parcubacteria group bacterium ADurb.Bin192]|jgi:hypothetical protein|nr:MAG: hypothetical protein BWY14_01271 [Parcubacteria group bacterium ADurb.Bin192]
MNDIDRLEYIKNADYEELLKLWRHEPVGSPWFVGKIGAAFTEAIRRKRNDIGALKAAEISKKIGWKNDI